MILLHVLAAMLGRQRSVELVIQDDARRLAKLQPEYGLAEATIQAAPNSVLRLRAYRARLFFPLLLLTSAAAAAIMVRSIGLPYLNFTAGQLGAMSAFLFGWAGLARLSMHELTIVGGFAVERAESQLFFLMCWEGMYLAVLAAL